MNPRRLYRCRHDRQLAGVAGGMAEYLELDPTLVRILWILSAFFGGFTILLYVILAFVIPLEPGTMPGPASWQPAGPAWGAPRAAGFATGEAQPAPGTAEDGGAAAGPDAGVPASAWQTSWHEQRLERRGRGARAAARATRSATRTRAPPRPALPRRRRPRRFPGRAGPRPWRTRRPGARPTRDRRAATRRDRAWCLARAGSRTQG